MNDEHIQMIEDCMNRESRLNDWEREFVSSIDDQVADGRQLSEKQTEILDKVWDKATEKG